MRSLFLKLIGGKHKMIHENNRWLKEARSRLSGYEPKDYSLESQRLDAAMACLPDPKDYERPECNGIVRNRWAENSGFAIFRKAFSGHNYILDMFSWTRRGRTLTETLNLFKDLGITDDIDEAKALLEEMRHHPHPTSFRVSSAWQIKSGRREGVEFYEIHFLCGHYED